jgi:hypothetical protein
MILLMLRDGSIAEVPQGHDIIHRKQTLTCVDRSGEVIASLNATEVLAYTCSEAAARRFVNAAEHESELEDEPAEKSSNGNGSPSESGGNSRPHHVAYIKGGSYAANYARH